MPRMRRRQITDHIWLLVHTVTSKEQHDAARAHLAIKSDNEGVASGPRVERVSREMGAKDEAECHGACPRPIAAQRKRRKEFEAP